MALWGTVLWDSAGLRGRPATNHFMRLTKNNCFKYFLWSPNRIWYRRIPEHTSDITWVVASESESLPGKKHDRLVQRTVKGATRWHVNGQIAIA
jgi:hypothetical protein